MAVGYLAGAHKLSFAMDSRQITLMWRTQGMLPFMCFRYSNLFLVLPTVKSTYTVTNSELSKAYAVSRLGQTG